MEARIPAPLLGITPGLVCFRNLPAETEVAMLVLQYDAPKSRVMCIDDNLICSDVPDARAATCVLRRQKVLMTLDSDFVHLLPSNRV